ncbi:DUF4158 domain-containing protein [Amycolatopsis pigmentata]|uniref:DUF4158 domain-containing protein n=1 Tax=Amycolatopsis pigmentata TaxID=450801 RepID=A0ABW5FL25_9PSEU
MKRDWEPEDLIAHWTLVEDDWRLLGAKTGATRLGFALLLKCFEMEGRFPSDFEDVPSAVVDFMAELLQLEPGLFAKYSLTNRPAKRHWTQIRRALGCRPATEDDERRWTEWLATERCPVEQDRDRLEAALRQRCRSEGIEPPPEGQIERALNSALRRHEGAFAAEVVACLGPEGCARLQVLLTADGLLAEVKADPGRLGLDTLLSEIAKLEAVRELKLPAALNKPLQAGEFVEDLKRRHRGGVGPAEHRDGPGHHRRGTDQNEEGAGVDQRAHAGEAARAAQPGRGQGRGRPPLGHHRPARHPQGSRLPDRVHRGVRVGRHAGEPAEEDAARRLLLCLFALGMNIGIRQMVATGEHAFSPRRSTVSRAHLL